MSRPLPCVSSFLRDPTGGGKGGQSWAASFFVLSFCNWA